MSASLVTLTKRAEFLAAARARRAPGPSLVLQARRRGKEESNDGNAIRVGYTCSKKVGNAVARNRAKRRLRAAARDVLSLQGKPGWDYVLIGRAGKTAERPYELLCADLRKALDKIHTPRERAAS
ncbi:MAG: ribonuclease P protein component [Mangrovicoccus sp.]|nr:ribonuclease P protein component [Mangrovicoccus sp.]